MTLPAWTDIPDTDVDVGSPLKSTEVVGALRDNARACRSYPFGVSIAEDLVVAGSWTVIANSDFGLWLPDFVDYTGIARRVLLFPSVKVDSGTTGYARLYNSSDAYGGTTSAIINGTSYVALELELSLAPATLGQRSGFYLQVYRASGAGNVYLEAPLNMTGRVEY